MDRKYQVFLSSTFVDLKEERQDAIRAILDLGHIPAGMEAFPATDEEQLVYIKQIIDECDYYVLIIGGRYGSKNPEGVSYTEAEYDYALSSGRTVLVFPHGEPGKIELAKSELDAGGQKALERFRVKASSGRLVRHWSDRPSLQLAITAALAQAMQRHPQVGWVRANQIAQLDVLQELTDAQRTISQLQASLAQAVAAIAPVRDDLAQLDDLHELVYEYKPEANYAFRSGVARVTWQDVFRAVGPTLQRPVNLDALEAPLWTFLKDRGSHFTVRFGRPVLETIQLHLTALGFVASEKAVAVQGGVNRFLSLTEAGERELLRISAIPKPV